MLSNRRGWIRVALCGVAACTVATAEITLLDFGTSESVVAEGWTQVTETDQYAEADGQGWVDPPGLRRPIQRFGRDENFSGQKEFLKLGPMFRDHVIAGRNYHSYPKTPNTFRLDVGPGRHVAAVIMGVMTEKRATTINRPPFWWRDYVVTANGEEIVSVTRGGIREMLAERGRFSKVDFLPGESLFDRGILEHFPVYVFTFEGPTLELSMNSFCPVNGLLVAPEAEEKQLRQEVKDLYAAERTFVDGQFQESSEAQPFADKLRRAARGGILFTRPQETLGPYTRPAAEEAGRPAGDFVPPGEMGILRFGLLPVRALRSVQVEVGSFKTADGQALPAETASVWLSQLVPMRTVQTGEFYTVRPNYAFPYQPRDLAANATRQLSVYVNVPEDAASGDYAGRVTVSSADLPKSLTLDLVVKVLPFRIDPADISFGMYWGNPFSTRLRHAWQQMKIPHALMRELCSEIDLAGFQAMREAGFNTAAFGPARVMKVGENGEVEIQQQEWELWCDRMSNYEKVFGRHPMPAYGIGWGGLVSTWSAPGFYGRNVDAWVKNGFTDKSIRDMTVLCEAFYEQARKLNWPEIIFYVQDEMANHGANGGRMATERARLFRKVADRVGFRTCASMNGPVEIPALPYLHIAIPNGALPVTEENLALIQEKGSDLWFYNIGSNRYSYGYYLNRTRPKGRLQWSFGGNSRFANQVAGLPSFSSVSYTAHYDEDGRAARRQNIEEMRQGILDYRYFRTLERLIDTHAKDPARKQAVAEGRKLREFILGGVRIRNQHSGEDFTSGVWSARTCQRLRWRVGLAIQALETAKR
jgi:hypothetical protein